MAVPSWYSETHLDKTESVNIHTSGGDTGSSFVGTRTIVVVPIAVLYHSFVMPQSYTYYANDSSPNVINVQSRVDVSFPLED